LLHCVDSLKTKLKWF